MKPGELRFAIKFALFPTKVEDRWVIWQWYGANQKCVKIHVPGERGIFGYEEHDVLVWRTYSKHLL